MVHKLLSLGNDNQTYNWHSSDKKRTVWVNPLQITMLISASPPEVNLLHFCWQKSHMQHKYNWLHYNKHCIHLFKISLPSSIGMTVFLRASTKPSGEPNRKKSDTSKSNFPRELPSSIVLLLDLRETASFRKTLECKLERTAQSHFLVYN